ISARGSPARGFRLGEASALGSGEGAERSTARLFSLSTLRVSMGGLSPAPGGAFGFPWHLLLRRVGRGFYVGIAAFEDPALFIEGDLQIIRAFAAELDFIGGGSAQPAFAIDVVNGFLPAELGCFLLNGWREVGPLGAEGEAAVPVLACFTGGGGSASGVVVVIIKVRGLVIRNDGAVLGDVDFLVFSIPL